MSKKLLISDANIIIDIVAGELVEAMFSLEYEFSTPDILYVEELEEQHPEIIEAGLKPLELTPESNCSRIISTGSRAKFINS